jgi:voltage-gated potassium channel
MRPGDDQMAEDAPRSRTHPYQIFMLSLCVFALAALGVERFGDLGPGVVSILQLADLVVCLLFLGDFLHSLLTAPDRWRYFRTWGWIDLLSSVPSVDLFRIGRAARILRILRVLRGVKATRLLAGFVLNRRAESAFMAVSLSTLLLLVFASTAVLHFEAVPESNIKGAEDALWWSLTTITTVGYGDRYPVTTEGRAVGVLLMFTGVGLVGVFSGLFASWFMAPAVGRNRNEIQQLRADIAALRAAIETRRAGAPDAS